MKSSEIMLEELKKAGLVGAEVAAHELEKCLFHVIVPRLAAEADEAAVKMIAAGALLVIPAIEPAIEKVLDFNKDGKIGE
jgi:hypothetical protein